MMASNLSRVSATYFEPVGDDDVGARIVEAPVGDLRIVLAGKGRSTVRSISHSVALATEGCFSTSRSTPPSPPPITSTRLGRRQRHQRHVRHHLVIDELVRGRELAHAVEHQHGAPGRVLEDHQVLVLGLDLVQHAWMPRGARANADGRSLRSSGSSAGLRNSEHEGTRQKGARAHHEGCARPPCRSRAG